MDPLTVAYVGFKLLTGTVAASVCAGGTLVGVGAGNAYRRKKLEEEQSLGINLYQQSRKAIFEIERKGGKLTEKDKELIRLTIAPKFSVVKVPQGAFGPLLTWMEGTWVMTPEERFTFCHFVPRYHVEHGGWADEILVKLVNMFKDNPEGRQLLSKLMQETMPSSISTEAMESELRYVKSVLTPARQQSPTYRTDIAAAS